MGEVTNISAALNKMTFRPGQVASFANKYLRESLTEVGEVIERSFEEGPAKRFGIDFLDKVPGMDDAADGQVYPLRGSESLPVVVISNNVASFFMRNGRTRPEALRDASLYATAVGFAAASLATRTKALDSDDTYMHELWTRGFKQQSLTPRNVAKYRFAAGIMNEAGRGIRPGKQQVQDRLTLHSASFSNAMTSSELTDASSSFFRF